MRQEDIRSAEGNQNIDNLPFLVDEFNGTSTNTRME